MTNPDLAVQLRAQADDHARQRAALLTASVALQQTKSAAAAIKALREMTQPEIRDQAIALIEQLRKDPQ